MAFGRSGIWDIRPSLCIGMIKAGGQLQYRLVRSSGYLEDYANLAEGSLALYEPSFEETHFVTARELADQIRAPLYVPARRIF